MIAMTMAYLAVVALAASVAAALAEAGLRRLGLATRWPWLAAMAAGPVLLLAGSLAQSFGGSPSALTGGVPVTLDLQALLVTVGKPGAPPWWLLAQRALLWGWAVGSVAFLAVVVRAYLRLTREMKAWRVRTIGRATVFVSRRRGPAVAGVVRPWIVVPEWVIGLPSDELRMVLRHEGEHVRAGDSRLVLLGLLLAGCTPWNPVSWWQLRRLRTAVEVDCDRRVLARDGDIRAYGAALLTVAAGVIPERQLTFAAFSENSGSLRTRIVAMTTRRSRFARAVGMALLLAAVLVGVQACGLVGSLAPTSGVAPVAVGLRTTAVTSAPRPVARIAPAEAPPSAEPVPGRAARVAPSAPVPSALPPSTPSDTRSQTPPEKPPENSGPVSALRSATREPEAVNPYGPSFTPFTVAPQLKNREEVGRALEESYPPLLRDAGVSGKADVWVHIDDQGVVLEATIHTSSGHEALDRAAIRVARTMAFTPALNRDQRVPVWVSLPIRFQNR